MIKRAAFFSGILILTLFQAGHLWAQDTAILPKRDLEGIAKPFKLLGKGPAVSMRDYGLQLQYLQAGDSLSGSALPGPNRIVPLRFSLQADAQLSVFQIPFRFQYSANDGWRTALNPDYNSFFSGNFDTKAYRDLLRNKLLEHVKPEALMPVIKSRMDQIRRKYEQKLADGLKQIGADMLAPKSQGLLAVETIRNLDNTDPVALKNAAFSGLSIDRYKEMLNRRNQLQKEYPNRSLDSIEGYKEATRYIRDFEGREAVYNLVSQARKELLDDPAYSELAAQFPFTKEKFKRYLENPQNLNDVASRFGNLSGIQKVFTKLTHLNMGQNPLSNGEFSFSQVLNKGIDIGMMGRKMNAGLVVGKNNHVNNWMQAGLTNIVGNEYSNLFGMQFSRPGTTQQSLSLNFFNFANSPVPADNIAASLTPYLPNATRQDAVISYQLGFKLGAKQHLKLDISRSMGTYRNMLGADSSTEQKSAANSLLNANGYGNYAAALEYRGELLNNEVDLQVSKVGLGYNNPGNLSLNRGQLKLKWSLARNLVQNKLQLKYQGEYRTQHFDPEKTFRYNSFVSQFRSSFRMRKGARVSVAYQRNDMESVMPGLVAGNGNIQSWQGTANFRFRYKGQTFYQSANLNRQTLTLPSLVGGVYKSRSLLMVSNTSLPVGMNMLSLLLTANLSNNSDYYFNTSAYTTELTYSYQLGKLVQLSSGLGFFKNEGWNSQIGLRQQLSTKFWKAWDMSAGIDVKRAIQVVRDDMANLLFIHATLTYRR